MYCAFVHEADQFSHEDACRVSRLAKAHGHAETVLVDLTRARDASVWAFAELILLRRWLLQCGRDLRLVGLHDRAAYVHEVNRLTRVLPVE